MNNIPIGKESNQSTEIAIFFRERARTTSGKLAAAALQRAAGRTRVVGFLHIGFMNTGRVLGEEPIARRWLLRSSCACWYLWLPLLKAYGWDHNAPDEVFRRLKGGHDYARLRQLKPADWVADQSRGIVERQSSAESNGFCRSQPYSRDSKCCVSDLPPWRCNVLRYVTGHVRCGYFKKFSSSSSLQAFLRSAVAKRIS